MRSDIVGRVSNFLYIAKTEAFRRDEAGDITVNQCMVEEYIINSTV
jgi:hypothetical protein